jgi:carboxymethylenebutenolidase
VCFFATDIHTGTLGKGGDNTLQRVRDGDLGDTEMVMIFGKQDNHVPAQGRRVIYDTMAGANADFAWMEVNAQHAFIRDELSKGRFVAA